MRKIKVSCAPSVRRLPSYLLVARQAARNGDEFVSGTRIAAELDLEPIQVRKDLAITGASGKPKRGYLTSSLVRAIEDFLGWSEATDVVVVGVGCLGSALMGYPTFRMHGLRIVDAFDPDPAKHGGEVSGIVVHPVEKLVERVRAAGIRVAILTTPSTAAQAAADRLVEAGVDAIWNFTTARLRVPTNVIVQNEDLTAGYAILSIRRRLRRKPGIDS